MLRLLYVDAASLVATEKYNHDNDVIAQADVAVTSRVRRSVAVGSDGLIDRSPQPCFPSIFRQVEFLTRTRAEFNRTESNHNIPVCSVYLASQVPADRLLHSLTSSRRRSLVLRCLH